MDIFRQRDLRGRIHRDCTCDGGYRHDPAFRGAGGYSGKAGRTSLYVYRENEGPLRASRSIDSRGFTAMTVAQLIKSFTLWEFLKAHALTLKYFFKPKATINYPFE